MEPRTKPGEWLEYSPLLTIFVAALLVWYLIDVFRTSPQGALAALDLNTYNLMFITVGICCCTGGRSDSCGGAPSASRDRRRADPVSVLCRHLRHDRRHRHFRLAGRSVCAQSPPTTRYPLLVALYSAMLGIFVPSGGSKWVIEAPYVLQAANLHQVHLGWVVQIYNAAEALPNLVNPFWMLPLLGS